MDDEFTPKLFGQLARSRKRRRVGDLFTMKLAEGYLFGRVISTTARVSRNFPDSNMLYIYAGFHDSPGRLSIDALAPANLLIPPVITNNQGWLRGYFETIENIPLTPGQILPVHCFQNGTSYWDEQLNQLPGPIPPVGLRALRSYLTIENEVARALGKPSTLV